MTTNEITNATKTCPNCNQEGHADIPATASGAQYDTWMCNNQNCRVARYYVDPDVCQ